MRQADWNQHCVRAVISQKDIKHAETSISNRPLTALRHRSQRGEMRGRLGLWGDAVQLKCLLRASLRPREDKIKSIRLSHSSSCFSDSKATGTLYVRWSARACVCVWSYVSVCVLMQVCRIWGNNWHRRRTCYQLQTTVFIVIRIKKGNHFSLHYEHCVTH